LFLKLHIFFLSFLLLFLLAPANKDEQKNNQKGIYQVAVKNNATVDNHQVLKLITKASREISQASRAGQASPQQLTHKMHELRCQAPR
jgi:hypothetical protein